MKSRTTKTRVSILFAFILSFGIPLRLSANIAEKIASECAIRTEFDGSGDNSRFESFQDWLSTTHPRDSVEFFRTLTQNESYKEFSQKFVRMSYSRSAQRAVTTPEHPRLIAYHSMGVVLGLVDTPEPTRQAFNRRVEGIRYDFENEQWRPFVGHIEESGIKISQNPKDTASCYGCHGTPFRPIWRTYRAWAGQSGDYGHDFTQDRFFQGMTSYESDPGQALTMFLNRFNYRRIYKRLQENPNWKALRVAAIATLMGCPDIPSFVGAPGSPLREALDGGNPRRFEILKADVAQHISKLYSDERAYAKSIGDREAYSDMMQENEMEDAVRMASLRYLFESTGTNVKNFSFSRPPGRETFGYGFNQIGTDSGGVHNLLCYALPEYFAEGGNAQGISKWEPYSLYQLNLKELCSELATESLNLTKKGRVQLQTKAANLFQ